MIGETIAHYRIVKKIASGGMGDVFLAEDTQLDRRIALKTLPPEFAADPERYAPRYGGFCAYGTSRGYKVSSDPDAFAVVDGKLYLNYSKAVQTTWQQDRAANIRKADEVWSTLEHSAYTPPSR